MLDLQSSRWNELSGAYGNASDIPILLEQLKTASPPVSYESEPWFSLWSALCHQSDVYTASYAAIPHIVAIAASKPLSERLDYIHFVSAVEAYRHKRTAPSIPSDLERFYNLAIEQTSTLILECLQKDWAEEDYQVLLGALAVVRGKYKLGWAITELENETVCPACDAEFTTNGFDIEGEA
ncbi:MAG: hypothetical protein M3209_15080 [Acidobacteriota bacterium]|nr:hypothetical protein [Acidobacteriota bacterium]